MKDLDGALKEYQEHFGKNYPLCVTGTRSTEEIIADIELCIDSGKIAGSLEYGEDEDH